MVHPHLLQVFQKIKEEDGKYYGFFFHDQESFLEKDSAYKDKEGFAEKCVSSKSTMRNTKNFSRASVSQQDQIDPKEASFLKIFYGGRNLDPRGIHPSLLQTLQKIDEEDGKDNQFFSHKPKSFLERSSTYEHKKELDKKSDSCQSRMDNGGQKGVPIARITHQIILPLIPIRLNF
jgi:hypothetical protein